MRMKVMVVGPTEIEDAVRQEGAAHQVYNRTLEFSEFILALEAKLKRLFRTQNNVYIVNCSGTGIMECSLVNFLSPGDRVIILSSGVFGRRWHEIGTAFGLDCVMIETEQGQQADLTMLEKHLTPETRAVFVTANETSTGTLCDLKSIGAMVEPSNAILIVDAISSLSANRLETDAWHCDVVVSSTHKAIAVPPGVSLISVSEKAWRHEAVAKLPKYYFDLGSYKANMVSGQTPFTPAISLLFQLNARLDQIEEEGADNVIERHRGLSDYLRGKLDAMHIKTFDINPSNGMVAIRFSPEIDAYEIVCRLRKKFSIQITPSPEPDKHKIARVGLFGNITRADIDDFVLALKSTIGGV